jgi:hypothetical protein
MDAGVVCLGHTVGRANAEVATALKESPIRGTLEPDQSPFGRPSELATPRHIQSFRYTNDSQNGETTA